MEWLEDRYQVFGCTRQAGSSRVSSSAPALTAALSFALAERPPTGRSVGELMVTGLENLATLLVRFRTSDLMRFTQVSYAG